MKHQDAIDAMLVERYLAGNLTAKEREAFETHYLDCEACLEELELAEKMRQGAKYLKDTQAPPEIRTLQVPDMSTTRSLQRTRRYAVAASVLCTASLVATGWMYRERDSVDPPILCCR